ncbi:MAG: Uma2 family endonuclease [Bacteroidota bacterium]
MKTLEDRKYSLEEYLLLQEQSEQRMEFHDGRIVYLAGGSANHSIIITNLIYRLAQQADHSNCIVFSSDMQLAISAQNRYLYPDIMVACGEPVFTTQNETQLKNPVLIIEVLSKSTESYDKLKKFTFYRMLPSVREFITIDSRHIVAESYHRKEASTWQITTVSDLSQSLPIHSLNFDLPLEQIYAKTRGIEQDPFFQ